MPVSISFHGVDRWEDNRANRKDGWLQLQIGDARLNEVCIYLRPFQAIALANWLLAEADTMTPGAWVNPPVEVMPDELGDEF